MEPERALILMEGYIKHLVRRAHALYGLPADELRSEAYLALLGCCERYDGRGKFETYAYRCLRGVLLNYAKKQARHAMSPLLTTDAGPCPFAPFLETESQRAFFAVLTKSLTRRRRELLRLHYLEDIPFVEIAAQWGKTPNAVGNMHFLTLKQLRERGVGQNHDADTN